MDILKVADTHRHTHRRKHIEEKRGEEERKREREGEREGEREICIFVFCDPSMYIEPSLLLVYVTNG